jgi:hypothetical protein
MDGADCRWFCWSISKQVKPLHHHQTAKHSIISHHATNHQAQPSNIKIHPLSHFRTCNKPPGTTFVSWTSSDAVCFHGWSGVQVVLMVNFKKSQLLNREIKPLHHHQSLKFTQSITSETWCKPPGTTFVSLTLSESVCFSWVEWSGVVLVWSISKKVNW